MNSLARFFLPRPEWESSAPALVGDEAKHCSSVLRKRVGDPIEVFDGQGRAAIAELTSVGKKHCDLKIGQIVDTGEQAGPSLSLAVAIPKGKTMDLIVQKAVELGVCRIQPLMTENVVVKLGRDEAVRKAEKWQRVALEACKQCGQNRLPEVGTPVAMGDWLKTEAAPNESYKVIASLEADAVPFSACFENAPISGKDACLLVGPEGDFSRSETELAMNMGFRPVSLGRIVMRVETAVFYAASVIRFAQGA